VKQKNCSAHSESATGSCQRKAGPDILNLQESLSQRIGTSVQIKIGSKGAGKLVIDYSSHDHLDELISRLH